MTTSVFFSTGVYHSEESPPLASMAWATQLFTALEDTVAPEMASTARDWVSMMRGIRLSMTVWRISAVSLLSPTVMASIRLSFRVTSTLTWLVTLLPGA